MSEEAQAEIIDIIRRKDLMEEALILDLIDFLGENKFYKFLFLFSGQTIRVPKTEVLERESRNEILGRTLDEHDSRLVRKKLREKWNLSPANLSMIYKKYKRDVETGQYDAAMKMDEHMIEKIKKRRQKGEISARRAHSDIKTFNQFIVQRKKDLEFSLKLAAVYYPESLDSGKDDVFAKALRRVRKQIRDSEAAKVRKSVRNQKSFFEEKKPKKVKKRQNGKIS